MLLCRIACLAQTGLLLLVLTWQCGWSVGGTILKNRCELAQPVCAACGSPVKVTVVARNALLPPLFELSATVTVRRAALLPVLEMAAEVGDGFRFKSAYLPVVGHYIEVINNLEASVERGTFWHLVSYQHGPLLCGVSRYIPDDGETVLFNFTTYNDVECLL